MYLLSINSGDTAWMLISSALVMLMTPAGLTLFYGGLTQRKSVLNTIGMSYTAFCTASVVWVVSVIQLLSLMAISILVIWIIFF